MEETYSERLLNGFLREGNNEDLLKKYMISKEREIKDLLDERFKVFFKKKKVLSYFLKVLHFESKHFDKRIRTHNKIYQLPSNEEGVESFIEEHLNLEINEMFQPIEEHISDIDIFLALKKLTSKQKTVLSFAFVHNLNDTEIAKLFNVSQQSITKTKKTAIKNLRKGIS